MSEKTDKKKKKKAKGDSQKEKTPPPAAAAPPEPAGPPEPEPIKRPSSKSSSKKRRSSRAGSDVFSLFTNSQVAEFKEAFALMDLDKDGVLGKNDLRATFDMVGKIVSEKELDEMLAEVPETDEGEQLPCTFTQFLMLFASKQQGGGPIDDDDDTVIQAFVCFSDPDGWLDADNLKHWLMTWGDKFTLKEVKDAYESFYFDDKGKRIDCGKLLDMLLGKADD
ncbi:myosin regulatory light chain 2-like [Thrips palmi]|uniref:Myosin regulatory light chain 2-like n=1 Tax=Thrips palmi TaxID=161013 RepID=A0A6P8YUN9_THRPL|nr:myosin regulatory light chain 2-like [Thrips palmi]